MPLADSYSVAVAAGANHSCSLMLHGGITCWGSNSNGQLGNGNISELSGPVSVILGTAFFVYLQFTCFHKEVLSTACINVLALYAQQKAHDAAHLCLM